jgi:hypothetical protein
MKNKGFWNQITGGEKIKYEANYTVLFKSPATKKREERRKKLERIFGTKDM